MTSRTTVDSQEPDARRTRHGTPAVPGIAFGSVVRPASAVDMTWVADLRARSAAEESQRYAAAVESVSRQLRRRSADVGGVAAEVLAAQAGLVADKGMREAVGRAIAVGASAEAATVAAVEQFAATFTRVGGLMAERITDLTDLAMRVVAELQGLPEPAIAPPEVASVLLCEDLAPADAAGLDPTRVIALATSRGGPTSHSAVIARQLGIPCIVGADIDDIVAGTMVLVNGDNGDILVDPDPASVARLVAADNATRAAAAAWRGPGRTADGVAVAIYANVQDGVSARTAATGPSEGVGLFRSELAFLGRETEPTIEEQAEEYAAVLSAYGNRRVVIRTLDAGSDKPMAFAGLPDEPNPALGVRGVRVARGNPGILTRQLDAIALAAESTKTSPWVMAPMVASAAEAQSFAAEVRMRRLSPGVMVEIPAAALLARRLLDQVDFLSIGTNDLAQYTMAADRLIGELAYLTDSWQPAVLHLVAITAAAGRDVGKPVGVCGEAAADPMLACALVGLGITSLSMAGAAIGQVGAMLASVSSEQCRAAADAALAARDPVHARTAVAAALGR